MLTTQVSVFVSYARRDQLACRKMLDLLRIQMAASAKYDYQLWDDRAILTGQRWEREIMRAIATCDLGLLLVGPAFIGSDFITKKELPPFTGSKSKPAIPVEIETLSTSHDLKGLQQHQLFRLDREKPFAKCVGSHRTRFVEQLYDQIERRLSDLGF